MNEQPTAEEMELLARITTLQEKTKYESTTPTNTDNKRPLPQEVPVLPPPPRPAYWTAQTIIGTLVATHAALSVGLLLLIFFLIRTGQF